MPLGAPAQPPRCAILPPVPVPYREPLFTRLGERGRLRIEVIYQAERGAGWDQSANWFPHIHPYPARSLRAVQRARPGRSPLALPRGLGRALSELDPACVVSWEYGPATLRALAWTARRRRPLVLFSELTPHSDAELTSRRLAFHRRVARRAAAFIVASSAGRARLEAMGVPAERIEVALQSADVERFRAAAAASGAPAAAAPARARDAHPVRVLAVGRLVPDKNLGALVEAFAAAGFDPEEAELELAGTGPLETDLRELAARLAVPVRFSGYVAPDDLPALYADADALALVSAYEPFGVTAREAVAAGLPLICTRTAGAAGDVAVEGENALLVDPFDRGQIEAALVRVVREPELRGRLAEGSRAVTARHPLEADAEAWERAVLGALSRAGRG